MSDQSLERAVMAALADNDLVHIDELAVEAHGDYVVLRGTVGSLIQRAEALRTARRVPGVRAVDALVQVRPLGGNGLADAHGDTVTLSGLVPDGAQRNRARRIALRVGGVASVHDALVVDERR